MKVPLVTVLSAPNAITQTAGSPDAVSLYIYAPFAVKDADVKLTSEKSQTAVVLTAAGSMLVSVAPPELYADPEVFEISFDVEKAVVAAPKLAELVYRAILKVCPPEDSKLCLPCKSSCLKLEHIADDIAIIILLRVC